MSDIELGSVISMIMENPELIAEIKRLAENKSRDESTKEGTNAPKEVEKVIETAPEEVINTTPTPKDRSNSKGKRSELLHALSPYISEGRQKALETFMTIADILDMMREK